MIEEESKFDGTHGIDDEADWQKISDELHTCRLPGPFFRIMQFTREEAQESIPY
jgi:hypothetical protein